MRAWQFKDAAWQSAVRTRAAELRARLRDGGRM